MGYIAFDRITKKYTSGDSEILALDEASFTVEKGELAVILGSSGAGKTTALNILGGMDTASGGTLFVDGKEITALSRRGLIEYRRYDIGFVFQFYNLVPNLTALENVELATQVCEHGADPAEVLKKVGLSERMNNFPAQLSGGEQQRVSIARALAKRPKLLLCDEPTGALDYETGKQILVQLWDLARTHGKTIVVVTHTQEITRMCDRVIRMRSGEVVSIEENSAPVHAREIEW